jgi:hypothetical protein
MISVQTCADDGCDGRFDVEGGTPEREQLHQFQCLLVVPNAPVEESHAGLAAYLHCCCTSACRTLHQLIGAQWVAAQAVVVLQI